MQTSSLKKVLRGCRLSRTDLDSLLAILLSDAGDDAFVQLEVERGIHSIESPTLEALLTELGNPSRLDNLGILLASRDRTRQTFIRLRDGNVTLRVVGQNETWVRGRFDELRHRLTANRRWLAPSEGTLLVAGAAFVLVVWTVTTFLFSDSVAWSGLLLSFAFALALGSWLNHGAKSLVILQEQDSGGTGPGAFNISVAVVTILLAVAGLWISWQSWQHPVN